MKKATATPQDTAEPKDQPGNEVKTGDFLPANLNELKPFSAVEAELAALKQRNLTVFNYNDPKDNAAARSHVHSIRLVRGSLERTRKEAKAAALEFGRMLDKEAERIETELVALIDVHAKPLKELEEREAQRKAALNARVCSLSDYMALPHDAPLADLERVLAAVEAVAIDDTWDEFKEIAADAKAGALAALQSRIHARAQYEEEQAELARFRAEKEEREQREAAAEKQRKQEEEARLERERKAEEERRAEEQRQREAEEQRVSGIRDSIKVLQVAALATDTPELIQIRIDDLDRKLLQPQEYEEFAEEALRTYNDTRAALVEAQAAAHRRVEQEQENARLRREQQAQQRKADLLGKIGLYRHFMPTPTDGEQIIASKQSRLMKPTASEYGDLLDEATEAWQQAFDALKAKREEFANARKLAEEKAAEEKRENSKRHRNKIHKEIAEAIYNAIPEDHSNEGVATAIVEAIAAGNVPHLAIKY